MNQQSKAKRFRALHEQSGAFVIPNPWDVGSARILTSMKFEALATTSSGFAHSLGVRDGSVSREQVLLHCQSIVKSTHLPVSADLENGYGNAPEEVAQTIQLAAKSGLAGGSIEDHTNNPNNPIFEFNHAVERIQAAIEVKQSLAYDFVLTARCENHVWGRDNLDDTIRRLQAFEEVGADVLYAPGLHDLESIKTVCSALTNPLNVVIEMPNSAVTIKDLEEAGVKRISIGSVLFLKAYGSFMKAAEEIQNSGSFNFTSDLIKFSELENIFNDYRDK